MRAILFAPYSGEKLIRESGDDLGRQSQSFQALPGERHVQRGLRRLVEFDRIGNGRGSKPRCSSGGIANAQHFKAGFGKRAVPKAHQTLHVAEIHRVTGHRLL